MEQQNYIFENAHHALAWSTEIMRRFSRPAISNIYNKGLVAELDSVEKNASWMGYLTPLPTDKEEKLLLISQIQSALKSLTAEQQKLLHLSFWGDWYSTEHLVQMIKLQEKIRIEQQKRLRLNHRYTVRQLAVILNKNYRTIHRQLDEALADLTKILTQKGLVEKEGSLSKAS